MFIMDDKRQGTSLGSRVPNLQGSEVTFEI
jgi:hypothetical protein